MSGCPQRRDATKDWLPALPGVGTLVGGRYRVTDSLGQGGMCAVLAARDEILGRAVALKLVLPRLMAFPEIIERFANEARSLARIDSRHVVRVLDLGVVSEEGESTGLPFIALELLRGQDLSAYAEAHGPLRPGQVVRFALEACDGLASAHAEGIIHRDLKPENLFVAIEPDGSECLKVIDFGIARGARARSLTLDRGVGSPGYMSPEQVVHSSRVDVRTDIWSLGVVMYELLAFRTAFVGESTQDLCQQVLSASLAPLGEIRSDLPPALVRAVERCLHRDLEQRFQDVAELAEALAPLDDWNPPSEVRRIRGRLEARTPVVPLRRKVPLLVATDPDLVNPLPVRSRWRRWRTVFALAIALTVPVLAISSTPFAVPALEPARVWSTHALASTQAALSKVGEFARTLWREYESEVGAAPAPAES